MTKIKIKEVIKDKYPDAEILLETEDILLIYVWGFYVHVKDDTLLIHNGNHFSGPVPQKKSEIELIFNCIISKNVKNDSNGN